MGKQSYSRGRLIAMCAALFLSGICTMGDMVVTPVVANIYETYADSPEWLVNLSITGPTLAGLPFCLLSGWMCDKFNKKTLMVVGFSIFTLSSIFGAAITNIYYFVALRLCATGVAWGITMTTAYAIFAEVFTDDVEHGKVVGWYESAQGIISAVLAAVSGAVALASSSWQDSFTIYLVDIPILIMLIFTLPSLPPTKADHEHAHESQGEKSGGKWVAPLIVLAVQGALAACCYFINMYLISIFVTDAGIGNEAYTGILVSVSAISSAISALIFGNVYKHLRDAVILPAIFIMGAGFFVMAAFPSVPVVTACVAIMSFAWPFWFCYFYSHCTEIVPATHQGLASGLVAICFGIATASSSYLLFGLEGLMGVETSVPVWPVIGGILIVIGIASVILYLVRRKKNPAAESQA